ncbi:regulator of G-protein signaling 3-like isoform X2 [Echeneis naucrates]|uniref:regulator of G-protein signaling 3-like isoform X2 n=1 Tax=Echeneis naucrates TaxID=173247 RepID=UPI001113CAED|nr:regulator of G-protein signaling 3-like isoform X2 [Echeneis naucrates]
MEEKLGRKRRRKRNCTEEELRKTGGGWKENRNPGTRQTRTQNKRREERRIHVTETRTRIKVRDQSEPRARSGFRSGAEIQSSRPEVKEAVIRKTRIHTSDQHNSELMKTQMDHGPTQTRTTEVSSEARSRSTMDPHPGFYSAQPADIRRRRSKRVLNPESLTGKGKELRTRSSPVARRTDTRKKRKIHPSLFRGRGQLWLSITPEVGWLIIHIHGARGLMGKCQRSCDSYVKASVTSDLDHMVIVKTPTVLNNKDPQYNYTCALCVGDDLLHHRLLVSVLRRRTDRRGSQLIGSMSFGIGSVFSSMKLVAGWFYLLGEELGCCKYLQVTSQRIRSQRMPEREGPESMRTDLRTTPDPALDSNPNTGSTAPLSTWNTWTTSTTSPTDTDCRSQRPTVNIKRGKDGFGFTISCDCPVRVQAVDPGGPAHRSGLRQGDSVLQFNGLPVETWKCVDLAHAIRSCPSQIDLVVWRSSAELRSGCEALPRPQAHTIPAGRKLLPLPTTSKHGRKRSQVVQSTLGVLGSLWKDRKLDQEEQEEAEEYRPHTTTLKGTHVTSSNGHNYIILSPVHPGGQVGYQDRNRAIGHLYKTRPERGQNFLHDPRPGSPRQPFTSLPLPPTSSAHSVGAPGNYGNYQNCTIVQSHLPCSTYGPYLTMAPKTLIFPVFVQPLDLCSPDRTLLMSEEMVLHQADSLPAKVTVLIYSDLLLLTREDEAGRYNVLQSPLFLNTLQLREVSSEPLFIYFLQTSETCSRFVFSLKSFTIEQKVRVCLCLHDNIRQQLVTVETAHSHQVSALPSHFDLLSLPQSTPLNRPSSPFYSLCDVLRPPSPSPYSPCSLLTSSPPSPVYSLSLPPHSSSPPSTRTLAGPPQVVGPPAPPSTSTMRNLVRRERRRAEEEVVVEEEEGKEGEERGGSRRREEEAAVEVEERQQGEGESASETSEILGGVWGRGLLLNHHHFNMKEQDEESDKDEEEEEEKGGNAEEFSPTFRPAVLRRSLSEGSLLQEPRSPRFLSDSSIHQILRSTTLDPDPCSDQNTQPPSLHTLRKQLAREGGTLQHMLLLLNGPKDSEFSNLQLMKKTKSLAADVRSRLSFLRQQSISTRFHGNHLKRTLRNNRSSLGEVLRCAESLEALLTNQYGLAVFRHFLRSEFSEENLDFWLAVEKFKRTRPLSKMATRAAKIYDEFISTNAVRQINVDASVRESTNQSLRLGVTPTSFQLAQDQIFALMETDSFPRFLRSHLFTQVAN